MDRSLVKVGNIVTLDDGREVKITLVHPDMSFEWELAPKKEVKEEKPVEKEETVKVEAKEKAPEKAKTKRTVKKTK